MEGGTSTCLGEASGERPAVCVGIEAVQGMDDAPARVEQVARTRHQLRCTGLQLDAENEVLDNAASVAGSLRQQRTVQPRGRVVERVFEMRVKKGDEGLRQLGCSEEGGPDLPQGVVEESPCFICHRSSTPNHANGRSGVDTSAPTTCRVFRVAASGTRWDASRSPLRHRLGQLRNQTREIVDRDRVIRKRHRDCR